MDLKFIVLAFVISLAAGEAAKKIESPVITTNDKSVELNKNEELPNEKDTSEKSEKLMHDVTNIAEGKPKNLSQKPIIDINKSLAGAVLSDNNKTATDAPTILPTAAPTSASTAPNTTTNTTTSTTTTTMPSTMTAKPTIAPVPEEGNWTVSNSSSVCIVMRMEIEFNITYPGNNTIMYNKTIYVPKTANATGHCGTASQDIALTWGMGNIFVISFTKNETVEKFHINSLNLTVNTSNFENISDNVKSLTYVSTKPDLPAVPLEMSYRCDKQLKQKLQSSNKYNATLLVSHTQFQAFMGNKTEFGEVKDCDEFDTPDIVPIAVGCVLSILVLIVLVAYLIGRRRSQNRGYLSM